MWVWLHFGFFWGKFDNFYYIIWSHWARVIIRPTVGPFLKRNDIFLIWKKKFRAKKQDDDIKTFSAVTFGEGKNYFFSIAPPTIFFVQNFSS